MKLQCAPNYCRERKSASITLRSGLVPHPYQGPNQGSRSLPPWTLERQAVYRCDEGADRPALQELEAVQTRLSEEVTMGKKSLREEYGDPDPSGENPRITCTYEIITEESAAHGDASERGYEDEEGEPMLDDDGSAGEGDSEDIDVAYNAVAYLQDKGATEPSSSAYHRGVWYSTPDADIDPRTGEATYYSYHLVDFTEEEEQEVFEKLSAPRHRGRR